MSEVTYLLKAIQEGDPEAANGLLGLVYDELQRLAAHQMATERHGHTLQPTALVHEAWLRLTRNRGNHVPQFQNRAHFFGAAAEAMRRILIESARRRSRLRHGGHLKRADLAAAERELALPLPDDELLLLDEALTRLCTVDTRAAVVVNLCFFVGLTQEEAARELGVSISTVERRWAFARAWLFREIQKLRDT